METTPKPITVVYRVALFSLVVVAVFVLLLFGHRGHNAARTAALSASSYRFANLHPTPNRQFVKDGVIANTVGFVHVTPPGVIPPPAGSWSIWEGGTQVVPDTSFDSLPVTASGITLSSLTHPSGAHTTLKFANASVPAYIGAQVVVNFRGSGVFSTPIGILSGVTAIARETLTRSFVVMQGAGGAVTSAHLAWTSTNATYARIDHGVGALTVNPSGTTRGTASVLLSADTVYTLKAIDRSGNYTTYPCTIHVHIYRPARASQAICKHTESFEVYGPNGVCRISVG